MRGETRKGKACGQVVCICLFPSCVLQAEEGNEKGCCLGYTLL